MVLCFYCNNNKKKEEKVNSENIYEENSEIVKFYCRRHKDGEDRGKENVYSKYLLFNHSDDGLTVYRWRLRTKFKLQ